MINFRSVNLYLILFFIFSIALSYSGLINLKILDITAYFALFLGISFFYSSYLKQLQTGIVFGSILFLSGSVLFVFTKFEIINFGNVFFPYALLITGVSLLISIFLIKNNPMILIISILFVFAGSWLIIMRGSKNMEMFLIAVNEIYKSYIVIFFVSFVIIFLTAKNFKKRNKNLK